MELFLITTTLKFITSLSNSSPGLFGLVNWEKEALGTRLLVHDNVRHGLLQTATGITEIAMNLLEQIATGAANCDSTSNPIATLLKLF